MRVFICLSIFSFMLATYQEECFSERRPLLKNGKVVKPNTCIDRYDGETHPIEARWSTAQCFICDCTQDGMTCCQKERETVIVATCKEGENPESCKLGVPRLDDQCRLIVPVPQKYLISLSNLLRIINVGD